MTRPRAVVVADDITGANDTGSQFARRGYRTNVVFPKASADAEVVVVDTETREATEGDAYETVRSVVDDGEFAVLYKKLDSTLRGNVAAELAAVLDGATPDLLLLAPAFPANGRTTENGTQLVDGRPVLETLTDSENLPASSSVPDLLSSLEYPVERLRMDVVERGSTAVRDALAKALESADGPLVVVADAASRSHLRSLATGASGFEGDVVYAGSGGFAGALSLSAATDTAGSVLGVVGSVSEAAFSQLDAVPEDAVVRLDPGALLADPQAAAEDAVEPLLDAQHRVGYAVVTAATSAADVRATNAAAERRGLDEAAVTSHIATALSRTVSGVDDARPLEALFTTGGTTTNAVLDEFGASGLELTGIELDDGIPLVRIRGGAADGTLLVTKAGSFGDPTTIVNCLDYLGTR